MQRTNATPIILTAMLLGACLLAQPVSAQIANVATVPLAQRFTPADPNGDSGVYDCMAAALAVSLQALASEGKLTVSRDTLSYPLIRQKIRRAFPTYDTGIPPQGLISFTSLLTNDTYRMHFKRVESSRWEAFLQEELEQGRPIIVPVADRASLYDSRSMQDASHVIVVTGLSEVGVSFADSWDGMMHTVNREQFAYAWGRDPHAWLAFTFVKNPKALSFADIH